MSIPFKQCNERNYRKGREFAINWICLHFTSGNGDTAQNNADYFAREGGLNASAHYFVDTERIVQSVKDGDTAWHCGRERGGSYYNDCRNANSIGIEMCDSKRDGTVKATEQTIRNAAELAAALCERYGLPVSHIIRHYDVTGTLCPKYWVDDPDGIVRFRKLVKEAGEMVETSRMIVDGKEVPVERILKNGTNYVKIRDVAAALGLEVGNQGNVAVLRRKES